MTNHLTPRYAVTAEEILASFHIYQPRNINEEIPIGVPMPIAFLRDDVALEKQPLEDTSYQFQIGISHTIPEANIKEWRDRCDIEDSGSDVSGVVVFDGDRIIAGYTVGQMTERRPAWVIAVHPKYRGQGLSTLAILQWFKAAPLLNLVGWPVSEIAAKAFVSAHRKYLEYEINRPDGPKVPKKVRDSLQG